MVTVREVRDDPTLPTILAPDRHSPPPAGTATSWAARPTGWTACAPRVREHAERGVDVTKIMAGSDPGGSQHGPDELHAVVAEAHRLGLRN